MSDFFKESDFDPGISPADDGQNLCTYRWAAQRANEKLKERGTVVYGDSDHNSFASWDDCKKVHVNGNTIRDKNFTALLINIEPIEKDSAEKILADLVETAESLGSANPLLSVGHYVDRAKALKGTK